MAAERLPATCGGHDARALDATAQEARTDELTGLRTGAPCSRSSSSGDRERELHADARRPQRLQALQRHLRPSRRRCAAPAARPQARGRVRGPRDRGPPRRRRVLRPALRSDVPRTRHMRCCARRSATRAKASITSASGVVAVPGEAHESSAALRLADSRMYAAKVGAHPTPEAGMSAALKRMLEERHPGLGSQLEEGASLAVACAESLGLSPTRSGWCSAPPACTTSARSASPPRS